MSPNRVNPCPQGTEDWIIWAAWEIEVPSRKFTNNGQKESDVIRIIEKTLKSSSFRKWRARVSE